MLLTHILYYFILFNIVWPGVIKLALFNWLMIHVVKNHVVTGCHQPWWYKVFIWMFIYYLFKFKFWWLDQHLIPDMWQLVFANISIKGWVINSNQHGFSDGHSHVLVFPAHYAEILQRNFMASDVEVVMYRWWSSHVFSEPFSKCSAWLLYMFIFTVYPTTVTSVNHSTFQ